MKKKEVTIQFQPQGEVSAAALIVQKASDFRSQIYFEQGTRRVNGKSIMGMMTMPFVLGEKLTITAEGPDEAEAIEGLEAFLTK